jgi:3-(3-hydroxy-phenyl)propionate hydroxylase
LLTGESADEFGTLAALRPLIASWTADVADTELTLLRVTEYTFRAQIADRWRRGNIFLLGDAAHLTPPFIGQGLGAGVRDAMNLAWKIAEVRNGTLAADALDSYEQERKKHAHQLIRLALNVGWSMTGGGRLGDLTRRAVLPKLRLIPGLRDKVVDSTTPALRRSALVHRSRWPHQLAGTLCPNPLLPSGQRLDEVANRSYALITRVPLPAYGESMLRRHDVTLFHAAPDSELDHWLRRARTAAALVRPDGTVMRAGRDVTALCRWYFDRLPPRPHVAATLPTPQMCR